MPKILCTFIATFQSHNKRPGLTDDSLRSILEINKTAQSFCGQITLVFNTQDQSLKLCPYPPKCAFMNPKSNAAFLKMKIRGNKKVTFR